MKQHLRIPAEDGLYWYITAGEPPEPVLIAAARYGHRMKAFNGREQGWLRAGEYLLGPVLLPPVGDAAVALVDKDPHVCAKAGIGYAVPGAEALGTASEQVPASLPEHDMPVGTWVVSLEASRPNIGRVKDASFLDGLLVIDIVLFGHDGAKIGRQTPSMGGPKGFEPCCNPELWEPIEAPDFVQLKKVKGDWGRDLKRLRAAPLDSGLAVASNAAQCG